MKNILLFALMLITFSAFAQVTPSMIIGSLGEDGITAERAVSPNNPYYGAKLLYNISGDVSNSILFGAHTMFVPVKGFKYAIPVLTNIDLNVGDTVNNQTEWLIGAYPYYTLIEDRNITLNLHGGLSYQILNNERTENELRGLLGVEVAFYGEDQSTPITLSVAPEFTRHVQSMTNTNQLSITGVVPIAKGLMILAEGAIPFGNDLSTAFQFGILLNGTNR